MAGNAAKTQATEFQPPAGLSPLLVRRGPAHELSEHVSLSLVELFETTGVCPAWDHSGTVAQFAKAVATLLEAEGDLTDIKLRYGI